MRTKWSGVLMCALGLHPTCVLCQFCATCALPKCASRAQNPTFVPYLRNSFSALESYSSFLWSFLSPVIAGLRPHNLRFANEQYYSFQIKLIFPPLTGTGRESIVLETVVKKEGFNVVTRSISVAQTCPQRQNSSKCYF